MTVFSEMPALGLDKPAYQAKLSEPAFRDAIRAELASPAVFRIFNGEWDKVQIIDQDAQFVVGSQPRWHRQAALAVVGR